MPTGDTRQQTLYFSIGGDVTFEPLAHITEVPEMVVPDGPSEDEMLDFQFPQEMTFTAQAKLSRNTIYLILGLDRLVPNNWLKMHHLPMRRGNRLKIYGLRMKRRRK